METPQPFANAVNKTQEVMGSFRDPNNKNKIVMIGVGILVVLAGIVTGGLLSGKLLAKGGTAKGPTATVKSSTNEAGVKETDNFKDTAEGMLRDGGIKGEGTYHLERPGGETKTVYLTSTVVDLSPFVGKKVQIWGQTYAGKHAPWLMDVGKVKVLE
ncbi:MAG TPA: hypothetical protein VF185_04660 [Patescibacteria group bacterium]